MTIKVSEYIGTQKTKYKNYFDKKVRSIPTFRRGQLVYSDGPPMTTFATDARTSDWYEKVLTRTYRPFTILTVHPQTLAIDENDIANTISFDQATPLCQESKKVSAKKAPNKNKPSLHDEITRTRTVPRVPNSFRSKSKTSTTTSSRLLQS